MKLIERPRTLTSSKPLVEPRLSDNSRLPINLAEYRESKKAPIESTLDRIWYSRPSENITLAGEWDDNYVVQAMKAHRDPQEI